MTIAGFRSENHPQQVGKRGASDRADDRGTPRDFFDAMNAEHGFTLDAAASPSNALLPTFFTRDTNGLRQSWAGHSVWCNPPYSKLEPWVQKAWQEMVDGSCDRVVMLLPANRCEQGFWQRHVEPYRDGAPFHGVQLTVRFLAGRMRFVMPEGYEWGPSRNKGDRPPFGCCLLIWQRLIGDLRPDGEVKP